jgi:hypothetical protein
MADKRPWHPVKNLGYGERALRFLLVPEIGTGTRIKDGFPPSRERRLFFLLNNTGGYDNPSAIT